MVKFIAHVGSAERPLGIDDITSDAGDLDTALQDDRLDAILSLVEVGHFGAAHFLATRMNKAAGLRGMTCSITLPSAPLHEVRIEQDQVFWFCEHKPKGHKGVVRR